MLLILKHELLKPDAKYAIWHIFNYYWFGACRPIEALTWRSRPYFRVLLCAAAVACLTGVRF